MYYFDIMTPLLNMHNERPVSARHICISTEGCKVIVDIFVYFYGYSASVSPPILPAGIPMNGGHQLVAPPPRCSFR